MCARFGPPWFSLGNHLTREGGRLGRGDTPVAEAAQRPHPSYRFSRCAGTSCHRSAPLRLGGGAPCHSPHRRQPPQRLQQRLGTPPPPRAPAAATPAAAAAAPLRSRSHLSSAPSC